MNTPHSPEQPPVFHPPAEELELRVGPPGGPLPDEETHRLPTIWSVSGYVGVSAGALQEVLQQTKENDVVWIAQTPETPLIPPVSTFVDGRLVVNRSLREVSVDGAYPHLTHTAFSVLDLLAQNPHQFLHRDAIYNSCWGAGYSAVESRVLDVYIRKIRIALGALAWTVRSKRSFGYMLSDTPLTAPTEADD